MPFMRLLILLLCLAAAGLLYIRLSPMSEARWHTDPATAPRPASPNFYALRDGDGDGRAPILPAPPEEVATALEALMAATPRVTRLAGDPQAGHVTYVQRSRLMGYPDAISIRLTGVEGGTRLDIVSRSRFGYGDAGVNAARVTLWVARLEAALAP